MNKPQRSAAIFAGVSIAVIASAIPIFLVPSAESAKTQGSTSFDPTVERTESLVTAKFTTPDGDQIRMYVPTVGAKVSGMIVAEVNSKKPGDMEARGAKLQGCIIDVAGQRTPVSKGNWNWQVPTTLTGGFFLVKLLDKDGNKIAQTHVYAPQPPLQPTPPQFDPPKYCAVGTSPVVEGPFNASVVDTAVKWNGAPANVLAESDCVAVIQPISGPAGQGKLEIEDNGQKSTTEMNLLNVELSTNAPQPMMKGATADLNVLVTGLAGLSEQDKIGLRVQLNSDNIRWTNQPERVVFSQVPTGSTSNDYRQTLPFVATMTGAFEIEATLTDSVARHGDYTSKEEDHPWEVSARGPEHKEDPSKKFKHTDALSARGGHTLDASNAEKHDSNVSRRATSQQYNGKHHGRLLSEKQAHSEEASNGKVHMPTLSKSEKPEHAKATSKKKRHEAAWSKSSG